jgi:hypothetical protein
VLLPVLLCGGGGWLIWHQMRTTLAGIQAPPPGGDSDGSAALASRPEYLGALAVNPGVGFPANLPWAAWVLSQRPQPLRVLDEDELWRALADLRSPNVFTARAAADRLAGAYPSGKQAGTIAGALEGLLANPEPHLKEAAARALAVWGTKENVPALVRLLDDPWPNVRAAAMDALAARRDKRAARAASARKRGPA